MELKNQVCSLELAKRLKELGVKQKSIFVWEYYDEQCHSVKFIPYAVIPTELNRFELYSAFTVAELGEMLPTKIIHPDASEDLYLFEIKYPNEFEISYRDFDDKWFDWGTEKDKNEADARAKMLIYLIENGLLCLNP